MVQLASIFVRISAGTYNTYNFYTYLKLLLLILVSIVCRLHLGLWTMCWNFQCLKICFSALWTESNFCFKTLFAVFSLICVFLHLPQDTRAIPYCLHHAKWAQMFDKQSWSFEVFVGEEKALYLIYDLNTSHWNG